MQGGRYPEEKKKDPSKPDGFLIYKMALAILCTSMMAYGYWDQKSNPKDVHGKLRTCNKKYVGPTSVSQPGGKLTLMFLFVFY